MRVVKENRERYRYAYRDLSMVAQRRSSGGGR